tara:strand:+ start:46308 stop:47318 length:1011 start_codon:yes stop_codon:yes gene_type:complete
VIAIHYGNKDDFSRDWKDYCENNSIPYKLVSCYDNNIVNQLADCKVLLWHVDNLQFQDQIFAKYLIQALENTNIKIFPNQNTVWHFDDKVAQKYLLEAIRAPMVETYVFYNKKTAMEWVEKTSFPKVFKLRKGGASVNVFLAKNRVHAKKLVNKAFGKGFPTLNMNTILRERYRKYKLGTESALGLLKGVARLFIGTPFKNMSTNEKGYIYFQEFLPNNDHDQRIIVIGNRAIGLKRMVRKNDFRASGSGEFYYDRELFDEECVKIAFEVSQKLGFQSMSYDFIYNEKGQPQIVEVSYCYNKKVYLPCPGYWDSDLNWHEEKVSTQDWILEDVLNS